ncbi:MAG TPA: anthranilate synthase component I, partial [Cyanobacteria bacterium UBA11049]|nr:anthranilate synthase component I [Cyanobacteria bacterium UBA11049]
MTFDSHCYQTKGGILVSRSIVEASMDTAIEEILFCLNSQRGGLLSSSYEYPGRYKRWAIGFVNPPLELATRENSFTLTALNERGEVLLPYLLKRLTQQSQLEAVKLEKQCITGKVKSADRIYSEEERSKQPSAFTVVRELLQTFYSNEDEHLGLYGAFGYDLVFQFETMPKFRSRPSDQRDLVLYLPDELVIVDYYQQTAFRYQYEFETEDGSTKNLPRTGEFIEYKGKNLTPAQSCDRESGEY